VLAQQRHGGDARQTEDLVRLLEAAAAIEGELRSEVHAQDTGRRQEQAGKEDALQALRKEVIRREELEAQLLSLVAKERAGVYVCVYTSICMYLCVYIYVYIHIYICVCVCVRMYDTYVYMHVCMCVCVCVCVCIYITYICIYFSLRRLM